MRIRPAHTIYVGKNKMFQILNRDLAATTTGQYPYASIAITNADSAFGKLAVSENQKGVLKIKFDDIPEQIEGMTLFTAVHANKILDFYQSIAKDVTLFIVNCEQGICRSAAVGAGLSRIVNGEDVWFFERFSPNQYAYDGMCQVI